MKLSILMPVFNEKYTVEAVVDSVLNVSLPDGVERELVIVDDQSTDGTWDILEALRERHPQVRLCRHPRNMGKGAAVRTAVQMAEGDVIVIQDADLEYDPADYSRLLEPILRGDADVVYGSRFLTRGYKRVLYFWHSLGNRFLTTISNMCTDLDLTDMETCYKMARAEILKSIPIRCNRFGIEPELTAKFAKRGCRIYEVPVSYRGRTYEQGKKITWRDGIWALLAILYFRTVDDLYNDKYGHAILHSMSSAHRFNRWMADVVKPWVGEEVLEIGAGMGNLTQRLLPRKSYVVSDVDKIHLDYLSNLFSGNSRVSVVRLDVADDEAFGAFPERFDTVVCLNVLEHVRDDARALANMIRSLRSGGRLCLLVPRNPALYGTLDQALDHHRRYTEKDLGRKLGEAGFVVEKTFTFNRVVVPAWYVNSRLLKRKTFSKIQLKIFDSLVWIWRAIDRVFPWRGISLVAIARKP